jgi:hypothetical protein
MSVQVLALLLLSDCDQKRLIDAMSAILLDVLGDDVPLLVDNLRAQRAGFYPL